jgi:hypothetical protein
METATLVSYSSTRPERAARMRIAAPRSMPQRAGTVKALKSPKSPKKVTPSKHKYLTPESSPSPTKTTYVRRQHSTAGPPPAPLVATFPKSPLRAARRPMTELPPTSPKPKGKRFSALARLRKRLSGGSRQQATPTVIESEPLLPSPVSDDRKTDDTGNSLLKRRLRKRQTKTEEQDKRDYVTADHWADGWE